MKQQISEELKDKVEVLVPEISKPEVHEEEEHHDHHGSRKSISKKIQNL